MFVTRPAQFLPDHVGDVPVGFRRQRTDNLYTLIRYDGDLVLQTKTRGLKHLEMDFKRSLSC